MYIKALSKSLINFGTKQDVTEVCFSYFKTKTKFQHPLFFIMHQRILGDNLTPYCMAVILRRSAQKNSDAVL